MLTRWLYVYNLFHSFKMWYILITSKYKWSWKQIPEVEWYTQEQTKHTGIATQTRSHLLPNPITVTKP